MGRTAVLSGNWYVFYWRTVMRVLITSQAAPPPEISFAYAPPPPQRQQHVPARAVEPERGEAAAAPFYSPECVEEVISEVHGGISRRT